MKLVIKTVCFHITCILLFAFLYYYYSEQFVHDDKKRTALDYILLSTTIQAGVGISDIQPIAVYGKIIMILQQLLMIMSYVFTLYIFNL